MSFEFLFGLFGLISSDSKTRHNQRLENDWRTLTPLSTSLFKDPSGAKTGVSPPSTAGGASSAELSKAAGGDASKGAPIFSTSGGLAGSAGSTTPTNFATEPMFANSSSTSSVGSSSGSISTLNSSASLIKQSADESAAGPAHKGSSSGGSGKGLGTKLFKFAPGEQLAGSKSPELGELDIDQLTDEALSAAAGKGDATSVPAAAAAGTGSGRPAGSVSERTRQIYCRCVCLGLWVQAIRLIVGLTIKNSLFTMDFDYMGDDRYHFLIPAVCLAVQVAAVATTFLRNNEETNWLVPFYSSKDYLIRSRSNFRPKMENYSRRVNISIGMALVLAFVSSVSLSAYLVHSISLSPAFRAVWLSSAPTMSAGAIAGRAGARGGAIAAPTYEIQGAPAPSGAAPVFASMAPGNESGAAGSAGLASAASGSASGRSQVLEQLVLSVLLVYDSLWAVYATFIVMLVSFYFNLICSIIKSRFHSISKIIQDLADSNARKTTNQARKITTLYLEHNEACELLDESNDFWQYFILFTYFTYIPAYCYCLYNIFFIEFEPWPNFITWVMQVHMGFIIVLISFSAASVSTEAHAPYTSLHTLSLIQLPLDVEVNITTFLHRVRGLTIGYSCYDLFAITNASMSNTAAACASYFLIVADFSRSSVFNNGAPNNGTAAPEGAGLEGAAAASTVASVGRSP